MDRCHRIGQSKPVLVFRLATANSVEGKMLKRAADKMALERLVIKKGAFKEISDVRPRALGNGQGDAVGGAGWSSAFTPPAPQLAWTDNHAAPCIAALHTPAILIAALPCPSPAHRMALLAPPPRP